MPPTLDRVHVDVRARHDLGSEPRQDFRAVVELVRTGGDPRGPLTRLIGTKGHHAVPTGVHTR